MIFQSFKSLLGSGRAWRLVNANISALVHALVTPFEDIRRAGYRIVYAPFLTSNIYADEDEQLADAGFQLAVVAELLPHNPFVQIPAGEDGNEEAAQG